MAKLCEIHEINSILSQKKNELFLKEAEFNSTRETLRGGAEPVGQDIYTIKTDIIRLLKEIADLNQQISIKYLSLAAEAHNSYEEENLVRAASEFAKRAYEAGQKIKSYIGIN